MIKPLFTQTPIAVFLVSALLAGCSGRVDPNTLEPEGGYSAAFVDTRTLVPDVTDIQIEATPGGAILRATGLPATQGYWDVGLTRDRNTPPSAGVLRYDFRVRPPVDALGQAVAAPVGPARSREVQAAVFIDQSNLDGVRQIVVNGSQSSRSARR